jgi:hypothetical protein
MKRTGSGPTLRINFDSALTVEGSPRGVSHPPFILRRSQPRNVGQSKQSNGQTRRSGTGTTSGMVLATVWKSQEWRAVTGSSEWLESELLVSFPAVPPLLQRVREICDKATAPAGHEGCEDCQREERLVEVAGRVQTPRGRRLFRRCWRFLHGLHGRQLGRSPIQIAEQ